MEKHFDIEKHLREDVEITSPSPDFSKKAMSAVMGTTIAPASRSYINKKVLYVAGVFFLLLITVPLAYSLFPANWSMTGDMLPAVALNKLEISKYFNHQTVNSLLFLNVLLGLIFLDKYLIRRPRAPHF
ncbi:hypothetical protein F0L74_09125 [Chitinophaga agrisoli]|uniref:Uncharacterized protein n=1 Tax=Chitinophaga agrisoli TaxID=2607653 RepID=A0A5B2VVH7_9BACT|nr:hypothetical protein [Chitinophaga agrisoli]KAA2242680.1 hypothetical protein F0L74_09125 [Chitinophaga agrisoli]